MSLTAANNDCEWWLWRTAVMRWLIAWIIAVRLRMMAVKLTVRVMVWDSCWNVTVTDGCEMMTVIVKCKRGTVRSGEECRDSVNGGCEWWVRMAIRYSNLSCMRLAIQNSNDGSFWLWVLTAKLSFHCRFYVCKVFLAVILLGSSCVYIVLVSQPSDPLKSQPVCSVPVWVATVTTVSPLTQLSPLSQQ